MASVSRPALAAPAFAAPGPGQPGLAVGTDAQGVLRAKLCPKEPCDVEGGLDLGVPRSLASQITSSKISVVGLGSRRRAVVVSVPGAPDGQKFVAVVVAPLGGRAPRVVFAGLTGLVEGADGVRQGKSVTISEPDEAGARSILVGLEREDLSLCGRSAVLSPEVLNPADLELHAAKVQRLSAPQRAEATRLSATRAAPDAAPAASGVLRALGASSAVGSPWSLTDDDPSSVWAENRTGVGRGEFIVMSAPSELPLSGFEIMVLPPGAQPATRVAPRELWLVTRHEVFHVTLPPEAARDPEARFRVELPKPVRSDCVALVVESAFADRPDVQVSVAELVALTELGTSDPDALAAALAGGAERARAAGAVLRGLGAPGVVAVSKAFDGLDEGGRRVALEVLDAAPCEQSVPVFVKALGSGVEGQVIHARDRVRRCGRASAAPLERALAKARGRALVTYSLELGLIAPDRALQRLTPRLARANQAERRALRVVLARASSAPESRDVVRRLLTDTALPAVAAIDLLRALGPRTSGFLPEASQALSRLASDSSFRTRYLTLEPAAELSPHDAGARSLLERALRDASDGRLRAHALGLAPRDAAYGPVFQAALSDPNVRVREAAAMALGETAFAPAAPGLVTALRDDAWPLVRRSAAVALGQLPTGGVGNADLKDALEDESPSVREAVAASLGARRVTDALPELRERLEDSAERFGVRAASAQALGALCDGDSADRLFDLARRLGDPMASLEDRALGEAALRALVRIHPPDLESRLSPLRRSHAARAVQRALVNARRLGQCARS